jgi:hypothetical protein
MSIYLGKTLIAGHAVDDKLVHKAGDETITGAKYVPTPSTTNNSTQIATTAFVNNFVNNKFKPVDSLPSTPDSNTFYFIPE